MRMGPAPLQLVTRRAERTDPFYLQGHPAGVASYLWAVLTLR